MVETFSVSVLIDTFNDIFPNVNILEMGHFLKYNFPSKKRAAQVRKHVQTSFM